MSRRAALQSLLFTGPRRRWAAASLLAAAMVLAGLWLEPQALTNATRFPFDDHASASLDQALNLSLCHRTGVLSSVFGPARHLKLHPEDLDVPIPSLIATHAVSSDKYCASLTVPFTNNENSLMLMTTVLWMAGPASSVEAIGRGHIWIRVLAVGLFAIARLEAGLSLMSASVVVLGCVAVLGQVNLYQYTVYAFLLVVPLVWSALCSLAVPPLRRPSIAGAMSVSAAIGTVACILANLRTSYWPLLIAVFLQASQLMPAWRPLRRVYLVWADRANGLWLLTAACGLTVVALVRFFATGSAVALLTAYLGTTVVLLLVEAAIIFSTFFLAYHSLLMLVVLLAPAAVIQAAADVLWSRLATAKEQPA